MTALWRGLVIALQVCAKFYLYAGMIYSGWVFVLLNWRQGCGMGGSECIPVLTQVVTGTIAVFRGILWPLDITVAILRGFFIDWLFLLNFFDPRVAALEHMVLQAIGLR